MDVAAYQARLVLWGPVRSDVPVPEFSMILFFSRQTVLTARPTEEVGTSAIASTPCWSMAGDRSTDMGFVLVIGRQHLDIESLARDAEIQHSLLGTDDAGRPAIVAVCPRLVVQHAYANGRRSGTGKMWNCCCHYGRRKQGSACQAHSSPGVRGSGSPVTQEPNVRAEAESPAPRLHADRGMTVVSQLLLWPPSRWPEPPAQLEL